MIERLYPKHAYSSGREFRAKKRRDVRNVLKALNELRYGCAYMPQGEWTVNQIETAIESLKFVCSVKQWGR